MGSKSKKKDKKGKKGKKGNLTEEEKLKLAEMKALAEKEKLVRRKRLTNAFLKVKKEKEYELLKINENKLMDLWRPRLRKLKCDEILEEYKLMKAAFERNYRKKDELIADLEDMLKNNDEEYDNAFDMHLHNLDQILEFYHKRLNQVREMYADAKGKVMGMLNEERNRLQNYQENSLRNLNGYMAAVNMKYKEMASDSKAELFVRQEEMRNKMMEEINSTKVRTDKIMRHLWEDNQKILTDYDLNLTPLRKDYNALRKRDDQVVATIDAQFKKMYKFQLAIENIAEKDRIYCASLQSLMEDLYAKRDDLKVKHSLYQQMFDATAKTGRDNISNLALISGSLLERLDEMLKQRERLMKCIERCKRRERLDEKVDPFLKRWGLQEVICQSREETDENISIYAGQVASPTDLADIGFTPKKMEHLVTCECNPCQCAIEEKDAGPTFSPAKAIQEFSLLERFWTRFNHACLERQVLSRRKHSMMRDNHQLKLALRNYMGGMNPLQHSVQTFSEDLMANSKRSYNLVVRAMLREWKRRERCRKVGGIRVH